MKKQSFVLLGFAFVLWILPAVASASAETDRSAPPRTALHEMKREDQSRRIQEIERSITNLERRLDRLDDRYEKLDHDLKELKRKV